MKDGLVWAPGWAHRYVVGPSLLTLLSGGLVVWGSEVVLYGCFAGVFVV